MRCSTKYVGLDVHQATTVATVQDSSGKIIARSIVPTEETALLEFFAGMRGAVHVAFEEGTQAQWLHDLLSPRVARVVVCDRRGTPRRGNKGDQVDSALLSEQLRTGQLRSVYHGRSDRRPSRSTTAPSPLDPPQFPPSAPAPAEAVAAKSCSGVKSSPGLMKRSLSMAYCRSCSSR